MTAEQITTNTQSLARAATSIERALLRSGWSVIHFDVDTIEGHTVQVRIDRADGRIVRLFVGQDGRAVIERSEKGQRPAHHHRQWGMTHNDPDPYEHFLGRTRREGWRSGLRSLSHCIADNPAPGCPAIAAEDVRREFSALLALGAPS